MVSADDRTARAYTPMEKDLQSPVDGRAALDDLCVCATSLATTTRSARLRRRARPVRKNLERNLRGEVAWRAIATEVAPTRAERSRTGCAPTGARCALAAQRYGAGGGFSGVRRGLREDHVLGEEPVGATSVAIALQATSRLKSLPRERSIRARVATARGQRCGRYGGFSSGRRGTRRSRRGPGC
jgi:hypothetical protein